MKRIKRNRTEKFDTVTDEEIKADIRDMWNGSYDNYDECSGHGVKSDREHREWMRFLSQVAPEDKPLKILDVGTGTGVISLRLALLGHDVKGIDLSEGMMSVAEKKAKDMGLDNIVFEIGDGEDTGEPSRTYDMVINRHLIWTLPHPEKAFRDWNRILKPGGKLIIIEGNWNYPGLLDRLSIRVGKKLLERKTPKTPQRHGRPYSDKTKKSLPMLKRRNAGKLDKMVEQAGFDVKKIPLRRIDIAEKISLPFDERLRNPFRRFAIIATKR